MYAVVFLVLFGNPEADARAALAIRQPQGSDTAVEADARAALALAAASAPAKPQPPVPVVPKPQQCECRGYPDDPRCTCSGACDCCRCSDDYVVARGASIKDGKPLVVAVGDRAAPVCVRGCVCTTASRKLFGTARDCYVVAVPNNGELYMERDDVLDASATEAEVLALVVKVVNREAAKKRAATRPAVQWEPMPAFPPASSFRGAPVGGAGGC